MLLRSARRRFSRAPEACGPTGPLPARYWVFSLFCCVADIGFERRPTQGSAVAGRVLGGGAGRASRPAREARGCLQADVPFAARGAMPPESGVSRDVVSIEGRKQTALAKRILRCRAISDPWARFASSILFRALVIVRERYFG